MLLRYTGLSKYILMLRVFAYSPLLIIKKEIYSSLLDPKEFESFMKISTILSKMIKLCKFSEICEGAKP